MANLTDAGGVRLDQAIPHQSDVDQKTSDCDYGEMLVAVEGMDQLGGSCLWGHRGQG